MAETFTLGELKVRPGSYFNIQKGDDPAAATIDGLTAVVFKADWGPLNEVVEVDVHTGYEKIYGTALTTDAIKEVFQGGAITAVCCRIGTGGTPASIKLKDQADAADAVTITAKHVGDKSFSVTVREKLADDTRKECIIYAGTKVFEKVSFDKGGDEAASLVAAFAASKNFKASKIGTTAQLLGNTIQATLTAGTNPTVTTEDYSNAFSIIERYKFNTICLDTCDKATHNLLAAFVDRIFHMGQLSMAVIAEEKRVPLEDRIENAMTFNSEKVVYVLNAAVNCGGVDFKEYQTAARIAGMIASCSAKNSLTHTVIDDFVELNELLTPTEIIQGETSGCLVLSTSSKKQVWIDSAINTLITPAEHQDNGWKKIRRTKTRYELLTRANMQVDELIGKVDNDSNGRATIVSQIQGIGTSMIEEGKLVACNVFESPTDLPEGDSAWFNIECIDKDSAEHIYLTFKFRFSTQEN